MFTRRCVHGRNRSQPFATVRNRPRYPRMAVPMGSFAEVVLFGGFRRVVALFRVAGVALRDIQTCSATRRKSFCVAGAILLRRFQKMCCSFRGTLHSTLHTLHFTNSTLLTPHFTLLTLHSTLLTPHFPLLTSHSTLHTPHFARYTPHSTLYTLHSTLHTLHFALHTPHSTHYTPHSTLYTLYIPHCTLYTPRSTLYTFHSTLQTGNKGNMYKTVQINYCRKVLCVTAYPCVLTSVPLTYV